jgi:hypothetical protein
MYWYNPKRGTSERVEAPSTDEQAIQMLAGAQDSAEFMRSTVSYVARGHRSSKLWY